MRRKEERKIIPNIVDTSILLTGKGRHPDIQKFSCESKCDHKKGKQEGGGAKQDK